MTRHRSVSSEWLRHIDIVSDGDCGVCVGVYPEGELDVLDGPQGRLLPDYWPFLRFCLEGQVYQFRALCFDLSTAPLVFTRVFALVSEWTHRRGVRLLRYLDDWLVIAESRTLLLQHRDLVLQLCKDLRIIVNWREVRPPAVHLRPVSGDADRHVS